MVVVHPHDLLDLDLGGSWLDGPLLGVVEFAVGRKARGLDDEWRLQVRRQREEQVGQPLLTQFLVQLIRPFLIVGPGGQLGGLHGGRPLNQHVLVLEEGEHTCAGFVRRYDLKSGPHVVVLKDSLNGFGHIDRGPVHADMNVVTD